MGCVTRFGSIAALLLPLLASPLGAQELSLRRTLPDLPPGPCELARLSADAGSSPSAAQIGEAQALAAQASQAAILGDFAGARSLLAEAVRLDPISPAIRYRLARLLDDAGEEDGAAMEYCRYLDLAPNGAEAEEVRVRMAQMPAFIERVRLIDARIAFEAGVRAFDVGDYDESVRGFSRALLGVFDWDDAHFNRGVAYLNAGRLAAAAADLEWYLDLSPGAPERASVQSILDELQPVLENAYSPTTALLSGIVVPGMGHFYTGRPAIGLLVLAAAGGAAGTGLFYKEVQVDCLSVPVAGECPPGQVAGRRETRPYLVPGIAAAATVTVIGALHAFRGARRSTEGLIRPDGSVEVGRFSLGSFASRLGLGSADLREGGGIRATLEFRF